MSVKHFLSEKRQFLHLKGYFEGYVGAYVLAKSHLVAYHGGGDGEERDVDDVELWFVVCGLRF